MPSNQNLIGQTFGFLTVIAAAPDKQYNGYKKSRWECLCSCGNVIIVQTCALRTGNTKSCGCFHSATATQNVKKAQQSLIQYMPHIFSARQVFNGTYQDGDLTFEEFLHLSQLNCSYCNVIPSRKYNYFGKKGSVKSYLQDVDLGIFIYNGLDRIDSSLAHNIDNVIPCCTLCNRAKGNTTVDNYMQYISQLVNRDHTDMTEYRKQSDMIDIGLIDQHKLYTMSVKCTFNNKYSDGDLTIDQFYRLSQLDCYYCGIAPLNKANRAITTKSYAHFDRDILLLGDFVHNGLDRVDSNNGHNYDNLIPCCKRCNFAKQHLSLETFMGWIDNLRNNYDKLISTDIHSIFSQAPLLKISL
jgi:5-methylcytosine-specific restriction endonuclease McrA